jgi:hypothetical protein
MADFWDQALGVLGAVAPTVASAFGGPLAGQAVTFLEKQLGIIPDPNASQDDRKSALAQQIVGLTPDQLVTLKSAEMEFQKHLADVGVDLERIAASDRDSARKREIAVHDVTPMLLAIGLTIGFFSILGYMLVHGMQKDMAGSEALTIMLGSLGTGFTMVLAYYFGSSASSKAKDDTIKSMSR